MKKRVLFWYFSRAPGSLTPELSRESGEKDLLIIKAFDKISFESWKWTGIFFFFLVFVFSTFPLCVCVCVCRWACTWQRSTFVIVFHGFWCRAPPSSFYPRKKREFRINPTQTFVYLDSRRQRLWLIEKNFFLSPPRDWMDREIL